MTAAAIITLLSSRKYIVTSFQPILQRSAFALLTEKIPTATRRIFSTLSDSDIVDLENQIKQQGDLIRQLKADGVDKATLTPHIETLTSLKARLPSSNNAPQTVEILPIKEKKPSDESLMSESEIRKTRLSKVQAMRDAGVQPFEYRYQPTHTAAQLQLLFQDRLNLGEEDVTLGDVSVAGRIMIKRIFGKLAFFTLQDETGMIQLQLEKNRLGESFNVC